MAKIRLDMSIPSGQKIATSQTLDRVEAHIMKAASVWALLTEKQRQDVLAVSPILSHFLSLADRFR